MPLSPHPLTNRLFGRRIQLGRLGGETSGRHPLGAVDGELDERVCTVTLRRIVEHDEGIPSSFPRSCVVEVDTGTDSWFIALLYTCPSRLRSTHFFTHLSTVKHERGGAPRSLLPLSKMARDHSLVAAPCPRSPCLHLCITSLSPASYPLPSLWLSLSLPLRVPFSSYKQDDIAGGLCGAGVVDGGDGGAGGGIRAAADPSSAAGGVGLTPASSGPARAAGGKQVCCRII